MTDLEHIDDVLLFSVSGTLAREVTRQPGMEFIDSVAPLYEGSKITKEVPLMVAGEYTILDPKTKQWQKITITDADVEKYYLNTPRDVALNYEHRRDGTRGWVRLKDTARIGTLKTSSGERTALFASLELFPTAAEAVRTGQFRDVSIELKPVASEIIGCALTSTPVMRDIQFYSNVAELEAKSHPIVTTVEEFTPSADNLTLLIETEPLMDPQEILIQELAKFGLSPADLQALPGIIAGYQRVTEDNRRLKARQVVTDMATTTDGHVMLNETGIDAAAQLLAFSQRHQGEGEDVAMFSVHGVENQVNVEGLLAAVIEGLQPVHMFGQVEETITEAIVPDLPVNDDPDVNSDRVAAIAARMKQRLAAQQVS